jgi:hypothetical protein
MKLCGEYLCNTTLFARPGTTGPMLQDKGDAAKITVQDMEIDGGGEVGVTAGIQLGLFTGQPGGSPWGTYAYLTNVKSRNIPTGCGIRLKVNVCTMYNVWTMSTHDGILNLDGGIALFAFGCGAMEFTGTGIMLQQSDYWCGVEIEAPAQGSQPVLLRGPATIDGIIISLDNGNPTQFDSLIKVAMKGTYSVNGVGWSVSGITVLAEHGKGKYGQLIEVVDTSTEVVGSAAMPTPGGFNMCSDMALDQWLCLGGGVARLKGGVASVPSGALYVDPTTSKLRYKDAKGVVHALYA